MPCAGARLNSSRPKVVTLFYEVAPTTFPATRSLLSGVNARIYRALNWLTQGCRLSATTFCRIADNRQEIDVTPDGRQRGFSAIKARLNKLAASSGSRDQTIQQHLHIDAAQCTPRNTARPESSTANSSRDSSPSIAIRSGRPSALHPAPTDGLNPNADRRATAAVSVPSTPAGPMPRPHRQGYPVADAAEPTSDCWQKPCA